MKTQANGRTAALLIVLHLALAFAPHSHADAQRPQPQQPARGISGDLEKNRAAQQAQAALGELPAKQKRWALIIGVDQYRDRQIGRLNGAANDARTLSDALVRYAGFPADQVILLATDQPEERQPTRVNVLRRLSNLASVVPADGLLLVSFAGHGMERGGQAYLLPSDAQMSEDVTFLEDTAVSVSRLKDRIRATGVKQVIVLLDACRNDPGGRADAPNPMTPAFAKFNFDVRNREVQAFATVYATAVGQRAYEYSEKKQGYFTWALVEGLKGGAANERGEVTLAQLVSYVQSVVPKRLGIDLGTGKQQRPFAVIEGYRAEQLVVAVAPAAATAAAPSSSSPAPASVDPAAMELTFWEAIKNSSDPADFASYLERFPDGTFSALARRRARPAPAVAKDSPPPPSDAASPEDAVQQIEKHYEAQAFDQAAALSRKILAAQPDHAHANLWLGLSLLSTRKYAESVPFLSKAIAAGEKVSIPVKHHHYVFLEGDSFCSGRLTLSKDTFEFRSAERAGDDFSVPLGRVYEFIHDRREGGRLGIRVGVQKGNKEDRRLTNFHPPRAEVIKHGASGGLTKVVCSDCVAEIYGLHQTLFTLVTERQRLLAAAASAPVPTAIEPLPASGSSLVPTVDQILLAFGQAVNAAKLATVTTQYQTGSYTANLSGSATTGTFESFAKAPNKSRVTIRFPGGGVFEEGFDSAAGWHRDLQGKLHVMSGWGLAFKKRNSELLFTLDKFKEVYPKTLLKGRAKIGEHAAYVIEASPDVGDVELFYFDTATGLLLRWDYTRPDGEQKGSPRTIEIYYEDYRQVDGVSMPFTIRQVSAGGSSTIKISEVRHGVAIEDSKFGKPSR